jgi:hypothetical protein
MGRRRGSLAVVHCVRGQPGDVVYLYRASRHDRVSTALRRARRIAANGYLAWIERADQPATSGDDDPEDDFEDLDDDDLDEDDLDDLEDPEDEDPAAFAGEEQIVSARSARGNAGESLIRRGRSTTERRVGSTPQE